MPFTKEVGNRDFYNYYKEVSIRKNKPYVDYGTYIKIIRDFNLLLREAVIYKAEKIVLPYKLGTLFVRKFEHNYHEKNKRLWNIDFKATKEQGITIYHGDQYGYGWKWNKIDARVKNQRYYRFRACRKANRLIADAIKNKNLDYYTK
jgi:hypothetical protein